MVHVCVGGWWLCDGDRTCCVGLCSALLRSAVPSCAVLVSNRAASSSQESRHFPEELLSFFHPVLLTQWLLLPLLLMFPTSHQHTQSYTWNKWCCKAREPYWRNQRNKELYRWRMLVERTVENYLRFSFSLVFTQRPHSFLLIFHFYLLSYWVVRHWSMLYCSILLHLWDGEANRDQGKLSVSLLMQFAKRV